MSWVTICICIPFLPIYTSIRRISFLAKLTSKPKVNTKHLPLRNEPQAKHKIDIRSWTQWHGTINLAIYFVNCRRLNGTKTEVQERKRMIDVLDWFPNTTTRLRPRKRTPGNGRGRLMVCILLDRGLVTQNHSFIPESLIRIDIFL